MRATASNCTNMELKLELGLWPLFYTQPSNCTNMELKRLSAAYYKVQQMLLIAPIWNWNNYKLPTVCEHFGTSNCTNMELKLRITRGELDMWFTSNCTNMELKLGRWAICYLAEQASNCTNMELKRKQHKKKAGEQSPSNCTNMELKRAPRVAACNAGHLLIAPIWNWNQ